MAKYAKRSELTEQVGCLQDQVDELLKMNQALSRELEEKKQQEWLNRVPMATGVIQAELKQRFGFAVRNLRFEHVDASGYWFSFELAQDSRRQNLCVRHRELEG